MRYRALLIIVFAVTACADTIGPEPRRELNVLLIGNSLTFFNRLDTMLVRVAADAGQGRTFHTQMVAVSGYTLQNHWNNGVALSAIRNGEWDYVVLQEASNRIVNDSARFRDYATQFDTEIRNNQARTVLFIPWVPDYGTAAEQQAMTEGVMRVARQLNVRVSPAGPAFWAARQQRPDLVLHSDDTGHPSPPGTYLAAAVFYATLFRETPESSAGSADQQFLRRVAWTSAVPFLR